MAKEQIAVAELITNIILGKTDGASRVDFFPQKPKFPFDKPYEQPFPRATPESQGISSDMLADLLRDLDTSHYTDMHHFMVLRNGKVICEANFAPYRSRIWHVTHSMCKSITGMAIGLLVEEGKLSLDENIYDAVDPGLAAKMHKAIAVIQFKVEGAMIKRHPEYEMDNRVLLSGVDFEKGTVVIEGKTFPMLDMNFPTVDPKNPLELSRGEKELLRTLQASFKHGELLHKHIRFLYSHGAIYKCYNSNLLYHGCIPMKKDGSFDTITMNGVSYGGKALMDFFNQQVQNAYFMPEGTPGKEQAMDMMWYLWCGAKSPVFGKDKMTTFEHYFVEDKSTYKEVMNPYYQLSLKEEFCNRLLEEFGLPVEGSHIINGHVPVKLKDGEKPMKAGGKLFIIDGGLSKAYQSTTGIAGYTLIYNSHHLALAEHRPFDPKKESTPKVSVVEKVKSRVMVADTDKGKELKGQIADLKELVAAYREGTIKERVE